LPTVLSSLMDERTRVAFHLQTFVSENSNSSPVP
jgi:hypothetical protein